MVLAAAWWEDLLLWSPNTFTLMSYLETSNYPGKKIVYTGRTSC